MEQSELSRRYAAAFADVVREPDALRTVAAELLALAAAAEESAAFRRLIMTAEKGRAEKQALLERMAGEARISAHTSRLLTFLVRRKRTALLPALARAFAEEADLRLGRRKAVVVSAVPLSPDQKQRIADRLRDMCRAEIVIEETLDESLMAGFQVRMDGNVYDGSLRGRLARMKEMIAHGG